MTLRKTWRTAAVAAVLSLAGAAQAQPVNLSSLHDALHLSAAQEDAWRAYTAAVAPDPFADARRRSAMQMLPSLPTPRRIDLITAAMQQDLSSFQRQGQAVKAFYNVLTPQQQAVFDRQTLQLGQGGGPPR